MNKNAKRLIEADHNERKKLKVNKIDEQKLVNQEVMSAITGMEAAMMIMIETPAEERLDSFIPTKKKQLK